ncbi:2-C-methyl-D-erythritol 4-phosphate cytidylyltransferase [Citricoccus zhacaiensis]|uniref:2-C-methyl-D-erythritol 4-phosphate cytidylyltransferase n=1 Tax=Citricoccus zhacaiensis TaxID=489142 RepID=A0ABQ2LXL7_9MICC|nr:2-C-methyl-D-erythritol 4-phosphate cytidylyltransferase [Citricoccus zhacaiensis]GGO44363.1 2-C-methyl-D-erythritol 4-phosphate cytidylyltransferase [Citricoccus zhacaiensis]
MRTTVLIVAAGSGSRLQAGVPKALVTLSDGHTMLEHCLDSVVAARDAGAIDLHAIAVVVPGDPDTATSLETVCHAFAARTAVTVQTVPGGAERADSVRAGLAAVRTLAGSAGSAGGPFGRHALLVHDAARPFVPPAVFGAVVTALESGTAAVVPAVEVVDTIKTVAGAGPEEVTGTLQRTQLRAVQTPQGFDLTSLEAAHRLAEEGAGGAAALTDDAMAMEAAGHRVSVVTGDPLGFKITTQLDLMLANALLASGTSTNLEHH